MARICLALVLAMAMTLQTSAGQTVIGLEKRGVEVIAQETPTSICGLLLRHASPGRPLDKADSFLRVGILDDFRVGVVSLGARVSPIREGELFSFSAFDAVRLQLRKSKEMIATESFERSGYNIITVNVNVASAAKILATLTDPTDGVNAFVVEPNFDLRVLMFSGGLTTAQMKAFMACQEAMGMRYDERKRRCKEPGVSPAETAVWPCNQPR